MHMLQKSAPSLDRIYYPGGGQGMIIGDHIHSLGGRAWILKKGTVMRTLLAVGVLSVCAASAWAYGGTGSGKSTCAATFSTLCWC